MQRGENTHHPSPPLIDLASSWQNLTSFGVFFWCVLVGFLAVLTELCSLVLLVHRAS